MSRINTNNGGVIAAAGEKHVVKRILATLLFATGCASASGANVLPTVSMTAPTANASFIGPATVKLTAAALDSDGTISKVMFYNGTTLLATVTTAPYTYNWTAVAPNTYSITAKATDNNGGVTTSAATTIEVKPNTLPTVAILAPANMANYVGVPATIALTASAADVDGSVAKVQYFKSNVLIGTATTAPYAFNWSNVAAGTYVLTAKATDNTGGVTTSAQVFVTVTGNVAPSVRIKTPLAGATFAAPGAIPLSVVATDTDGAVMKVQYFNGSTLVATGSGVAVGNIPTPNFPITWNNVAVGDYVLTAKATDDKGAVTTSDPIAVKVKANVAPTVAITSPANNANFAAPANPELIATVGDIDGSIQKVEFYNGTTLIATVNSAPFSVQWSNPPIGTYTIKAKATDDKGAVTTSAAVVIKVNANVAPTVSITAPTANASFAAPANTLLTAGAVDIDGTIRKVEFFQGPDLIGTATVAPYQMHWSSGVIGTYRFTARATDELGAATTSAEVVVSVKANTPPTVNLTAPSNNASWGAPALVTLAANALDSDGTITKVEFYGNGSLIGTATAAPYSVSWANVAAGDYSVTAKATDDKGAFTTSTAVPISIKTNVAPTVSLTAPASNAPYIGPALIAVAASAIDSDGTISKVEFYGDAVLIGTATSAPYAASWANVAEGKHAITAKAFDNSGAVTLSTAVTVTVARNAAPVVGLTATPANAAAPALITLTATAQDSDGSIAKMEFFNGTTLLATVTQAPFTYAWANVAAGTHSIMARATDNLGGVADSIHANVTVSGIAAQVYYIDSDQINTPRLIANQAGQVVWQTDLEPFGANLPDENPTGLGKFAYNPRFPGQYFDRETGLHYNYYRDYDPQTGRYVQSDPIGLKGGINTYAYVRENPIADTDPKGLAPSFESSGDPGVNFIRSMFPNADFSEHSGVDIFKTLVGLNDAAGHPVPTNKCEVNCTWTTVLVCTMVGGTITAISLGADLPVLPAASLICSSVVKKQCYKAAGCEKCEGKK